MRTQRGVRTVLAAALLLAAAPVSAQTMPPGFVALTDIDPSIRQEMRYAGSDNFTGRPLPGYERGACVLQRAAALALKRVQIDLARERLSLKVYDCYRPARAVAAMARWAAQPNAIPDTRRFYPSVDKRRVFALGYIAAHSAHSRGIAIDLTIVPRDATVPAAHDPRARYGSCIADANKRAPDDSLDMGTGFDCFDVKSHTFAGGLTEDQRRNRALLLAAMRRRGFHNYAREWWHYTYPAADPRREYDFPVR
jgi:D-alanyl-D-alanine dipeptidase